MGPLTKATRPVGAFLRDERGAMTILALMMTVMLLGFGALVVDIGRLYNLHSQMQSYVDQVALAAAAELDGQPGAIERARRAVGLDGASELVEDFQQNFAANDAENNGPKLTIQAPEFYRRLPPDNDPDYDGKLARPETDLDSQVTADPIKARFVRIKATPSKKTSSSCHWSRCSAPAWAQRWRGLRPPKPRRSRVSSAKGRAISRR